MVDAATAPDLGNPTTIALFGLIGAFLGNGLARLRDKPRAEVNAAAADFAFYGTGLGILTYVIAVIAGV